MQIKNFFVKRLQYRGIFIPICFEKSSSYAEINSKGLNNCSNLTTSPISTYHQPPKIKMIVPNYCVILCRISKTNGE